MKELAASSCGATAIEYALIASLISIVVVGGVTSVGSQVKGLFNQVVDAFPK